MCFNHAAGTSLLGISWSVGYSPNTVGVTADMSAYNTDLPTFYNQTADTQNVLYSDSGGVKITAFVGYHRVSVDFHQKFRVDAERMSKHPSIPDPENYFLAPVIMVAVAPK